ncbi:MAG: YceI family protein [Vicingaceae bacterium]
MKTTLFTLATIATIATTNAQTFTVDTDQSKVMWHAEKVTGEHDGHVNVKSGELVMTDGKLSGGKFTMDMTSIVCTDLEGEWKEKLETHLRSADFFSVQKHPTAEFVMSKVVHEGKDRYKVEGKMTIKKITKDVKFLAFVSEEGGEVSGNADITMDRTDFDIRYGSGSFFDDLGDKTIYDEFTLKVELTASKAGN